MAENTLMDFPRTVAVLEELAADIRDGYIDMIESHGHTYKGKLAESMRTIRVEVEAGGQTIAIVADLEFYWKYLEEGIAPDGRYPNPGWKAYPAISEWVKIKPVIPRPGNDGNIPTPEQLAYLITRKIVNEGISAKNLLQTTKDNVIPLYEARIREALTEDTATYITMTWGTVSGAKTEW